MEICLCPALFLLSINSSIASVYVSAEVKLQIRLLDFLFLKHSFLFPSLPKKSQGQAEGELLNPHCCGLNILWNCTSDFLCRHSDPPGDYFSASLLVADLLHQSLPWLPLLSIANTSTVSMRIPVYIICFHSCTLSLFTFITTGSRNSVGVETGLFSLKKKEMDRDRWINIHLQL